MEEIIKILEEHNIKCLVTKCVHDSDDLTISHKNFYIDIQGVTFAKQFDSFEIVEISNGIIKVAIYYKNEYIHITVL